MGSRKFGWGILNSIANIRITGFFRSGQKIPNTSIPTLKYLQKAFKKRSVDYFHRSISKNLAQHQFRRNFFDSPFLVLSEVENIHHPSPRLNTSRQHGSCEKQERQKDRRQQNRHQGRQRENGAGKGEKRWGKSRRARPANEREGYVVCLFDVVYVL